MDLFATLYHLGIGWTRAVILRQQLPLLTSWNLTFHCNKRCVYCASPYLKVPELATPDILQAIDEFHALGMRWITFSGGEPLLRNDIGTLVDHCKDLGITTFISTNGTLLPRRIEQIARVDRITISLDGGAEVHDQVRGAGSWGEAVEAIRICRQRGIRVGLTCVLSRNNLHSVEEVLAFAKEQGIYCMFQPATLWLDSGTDPNPIAPEPGPYREAIDLLMQCKRAGAPVANSPAGLRILRRWPGPVSVASTSGCVTCTIEPDGKVLAAHLTQTDSLEKPRTDNLPPWELFKSMKTTRRSQEPWCAPILELDLLFSLNPSAIWNAFRVQR